MSMEQNRAVGLEMVELRRHLMAVMLAVDVLLSPGNSIRFPPIVNLVLCVSFLWGRMSQTSRA